MHHDAPTSLMASKSKRHDFTSTTKASLARRAAFQCAICQAITVGPSTKSPASVSNIGVAAHITAAAPSGPRYDASLTSSQRSDITNGIWLCQNHAKLIDDDDTEWTVPRLYDIKTRHENHIISALGTPTQFGEANVQLDAYDSGATITVREYAFAIVSSLTDPYRTVLDPILRDRNLPDTEELGLLLCGTSPEEHGSVDKGTPWTLFVDSDWLHWMIDGQSSGYKAASEIPKEHIHGKIPVWPDSFFEFLAAIVLADATFEWRRHSDGYLVLCQ